VTVSLTFRTEKDFESFLVDNEEFLFREFGGEKLFRQVRVGRYGVIDLLSIEIEKAYDDFHIYIHVFELKNTEIKYSHLGQCARYKKFFDSVSIPDGMSLDVYYHLIGLPTFPTNDDLIFICQDIDWLDVNEVVFSPFDGMRLNHISGWDIKESYEGDNNDTFRELFNGYIDSIISKENQAEVKEDNNG